MKNLYKYLGIIAFTAIIGFLMVACGGGEDDIGGGGGDTIDPNNITSIDAFRKFLITQPQNTPTSAYNVKLNVSDLGGDISTNGSLGWVLYLENKRYVNIDLSGSTITTIPGNAFYNIGYYEGGKTLIGIILPNSVTSIGKEAFRQTGLTSVNIPNSVTSIGESAFWNCKSLTSVTIGNSVTSIGEYTFFDCESLTSVTIGNGVTSIGKSSFSNCINLTSITIPNSVTNIGENAFTTCYNLTSVTFQRADTFIEDDSSFFGGFSLKSAYSVGGKGTYTTTAPANRISRWTKQE